MNIQSLGLAIACAVAICSSAQADGVTAVLKSPSLINRLNATTGAFMGSISVSNAVDVGCDGQTIAALLANGTVNRYDASNGSFQGSISVGGNAQSVQVSGGVIIVRTASDIKRYKASNGAFMGSSSI